MKPDNDKPKGVNPATVGDDDELVVLSVEEPKAPNGATPKRKRNDMWLNNSNDSQNSQNYNNSNNSKGFFEWHVILWNVLLMVCTGLILCWLSYLLLDVWTGHGDERTVPNVIGRSYDAGRTALENTDLGIIVSDSVFDNPAAPGTIIDQNPHEGARVKNGRSVYVTIVAFSPKMVVVPNLETSGQQAIERLRAMGVTNLDTVMVVAEDRVGLVLGATCNGHQLHRGDKIPVNSRVTLTIGMKRPMAIYNPEEEENDSTALDDETIDADAQRLTEALRNSMTPDHDD